VYPGQDRHVSLIDIALNWSLIDFTNNHILSESVYDTLLLRYLQDSNPVATDVYFYCNAWSTPVQNARSIYTTERGRDTFQEYNQHYGRNWSDNFSANGIYASLEQTMNTNKCNLDLIPEQHKRWEPSASLLVESEVVPVESAVIPLPPGC
jgi:hypothetical protein